VLDSAALLRIELFQARRQHRGYESRGSDSDWITIPFCSQCGVRLGARLPRSASAATGGPASPWRGCGASGAEFAIAGAFMPLLEVTAFADSATDPVRP